VTAQRLVFVPTVADAPHPLPGARVVVLDTAWTPTDDGRSDIVPLRAVVSSVVERHDLFHESLTILDAWAHKSSLAERMTVDGISWWYRVRPSIVDVLHERLMWVRLIGVLVGDAIDGDHELELVVPGDEVALSRVAEAFAGRGATVMVLPATEPGAPVAAQARAETASGGWLAGLRSRRAEPDAEQEVDRRVSLLDARLDALASADARILVIAQPRVYQTVRGPAGERSIDPHLEPVIEALSERAMTPIVIGLELDHKDDADWATLEADDRLYPQSLVNVRWPAGQDPTGDIEGVTERIEALADTPFVVSGLDLTALLLDELRRYGGSWLLYQLRIGRRAERMMHDVRPAAMFLDHEGIRTPWVAAARRAGVPILAVQHGLIYDRHAVYSHRRRPGMLLPEVTFTFGSYEREVLLRYGGYRPAEVEVSGSPRLDLDAGASAARPAGDEAERAVRRSLGVAPEATLLVVSTAHTTLFRRFYLPHMLDRLLGGPIPDLHIVFKQHPGERDEGPYRALIDGLARARGYEPPPVSVVRDTDLFALLRAADAHLGLHSTVLTDAVVAGTPNLISAAQAYGDLLGYVEAGVARPVRTVDDVRAALADTPVVDPAARAAFLEAHFRPGHASGLIADSIARVTGTVLTSVGR
jgi:hypothetical protein